jgi:hypothetical protein
MLGMPCGAAVLRQGGGASAQVAGPSRLGNTAGVLAARQASGSVRRWPSCQPGDLSLLAVSSSSLTGRVRLFVVVPVARSSCLTRSANAASPQLPTRKHKPLPQLRFAQ